MAYDLLNKRFGKLTVIELTKDRSHKERHWKCLCDCGNEHIAKSSSLVHGRAIQCRNCSMKQIAESNKKHGCEPKRLHEIYTNMKTRCHNPKYSLYHRYGGRGIKVCPEWEESFSSFRSWALSSGYEDGLSLDRADNDGDYTPENCRWSTIVEQANNRRTNRIISYKGESDTLANWARKIGMSYAVLQARLNAGWSIERAFNEAVRKR